MNARQSMTILGENVISAANEAMRDVWASQLDKASIHTANYTHNWLENSNVHVLD